RARRGVRGRGAACRVRVVLMAAGRRGAPEPLRAAARRHHRRRRRRRSRHVRRRPRRAPPSASPGYDGAVSVRKAVFPAAGLGTRFLPATKAQPKEMLPLVDKPMIQYVVEEAVASGLSENIIAAREPCMRQLLDVFERYNEPVLAVERVPRERLSQYGVIAARQVAATVYEILDLVEKPRPSEAPSDLAIIGRYVLTSDLFGI